MDVSGSARRLSRLPSRATATGGRDQIPAELALLLSASVQRFGGQWVLPSRCR